MKLHNTRSRQVEDFTPLQAGKAAVYSCGPTVYDHIHIGNLSSFVFADTLRRTLQASCFEVAHVMNLTDVDDKTIRRAGEQYPDLDPNEALPRLTQEYGDIFMDDMRLIGNGVDDMQFVRATDHMHSMKELTERLFTAGVAYIADDGVYFSIAKYRSLGKTYGQLLELTEENTGEARIQNDEYDKESPHDFALWKKLKPGEPSWEFELGGQQLDGRPGWHIECSAMIRDILDQPIDIHTGGVDLVFPHHENEIAQCTALVDDPLANFFVHNEHLLVDGKKMSKSLNNFYTLQDVVRKGYEPLAFRLMMLQAHYRNQTNFTWDNLEAAQNRLRGYQAVADLRFQTVRTEKQPEDFYENAGILGAMQDDLNSPQALSVLSGIMTTIEDKLVAIDDLDRFMAFLERLDSLFGLNLLQRIDINEAQKRLIAERQAARDAKDWARSDELRDQLKTESVGIRDTPLGPVWFRL